MKYEAYFVLNLSICLFLSLFIYCSPALLPKSTGCRLFRKQAFSVAKCVYNASPVMLISCNYMNNIFLLVKTG